MFSLKNRQGGMLLIDALVGIGLFVLVFASLFGVLRMSIKTITNTKSRIGALALADEELEYLRSLSYDNVGTSGGIPSGTIPQSETVLLNNINYTRHVQIDYVDDPADGVGYSGANPDTDGILTDYKKATVSVSWVSGVGGQVSLSTIIIPKGMEVNCAGCGSLLVHVRDEDSATVPGADVTLTSSSSVPPYNINITRKSDPVSGDATFIGVPVGPGGMTYHVVVTSPGYSTDQTYTADAVNVSPNPADFSIIDKQSTETTFRIDYLGSKTINVFKTPALSTWIDNFVDSSKLSALSSTTVDSQVLTLQNVAGVYSNDGNATSVWITPSYLFSWASFSWNSTIPANTSIVYKVLYSNSGIETLIPDTDLPGNSTGFTSSPVNLSSLNIATYPKIKVKAFLHTDDTSVTPSVLSWTVTNMKHEPFPNFSLHMHGDKTIGTDSGGNLLYKYSHDLTSNSAGTIAISPLEWDTYTITAPNYDISESCPLQPKLLRRGEAEIMNIDFLPQTANSLLVSVKDNTGVMVSGATVHLYRSGFDKYQKTSACGQTFYSGLSEGTQGNGDAYSLDVGAPSFSTTTISVVNVTGVSQAGVVLQP